MANAFSQNENTEVILGLPKQNREIYENALLKTFGFEITEFKTDYYSQWFKDQRLNRFLLFMYVSKLIRKYKPDVVYTRDVVILVSSVFNKNVSFCYESHNSLLHNKSKIADRVLKKALLWFSKRKNIIKIIPISENLANFWIKSGLVGNKMLPLHDGFSLKLFNKEIGITEARKQLDFPEDKKIAIYLGSLYEDRETDTILKLAQYFKDILFKIIGGPMDAVQIFEKKCNSQSIKNIEFQGMIDHSEIARYLYSADILLALWSSKVPTINYCSPLKLFEYMASGRIIVAHAFPTIKEVLAHGENAILVEPESFDDLVKKFGEAVDIEYPSVMAENARKLAFDKYSWNRRAKTILENIQQ